MSTTQLTPLETAVLQVLRAFEIDGRRYAPNPKRDAKRMEIWKANGRERHQRLHEAGDIGETELDEKLKKLNAITLAEFLGPTLARPTRLSTEPSGRLRYKVTPESLIPLEFNYLPPHVDARLCWPADESRSSALDRAMQLLAKRGFIVETECRTFKEASYYRLSEGVLHCELTWTAEGRGPVWKIDLEVPMREHIRSAYRSSPEAYRRKVVASLSTPEELFRGRYSWEHLARRRKTDYQITSDGLEAIEGKHIILSLAEPDRQGVSSGENDNSGAAQSESAFDEMHGTPSVIKVPNAGEKQGPRVPHEQWLTVSECAELLLSDVSGLDLNKAKARVSWAAGKEKFRTNGAKGNARRIDRDSFSTWRLEQRERDLDADDEGPE